MARSGPLNAPCAETECQYSVLDSKGTWHLESLLITEKRTEINQGANPAPHIAGFCSLCDRITEFIPEQSVLVHVSSAASCFCPRH